MVLLRDKAVRQLAVRYLPIILQAALPTLQPEALASGIVIEDDQLYLLEGIGWLLAEDAISPADRVEHVLGFVDPLLRYFVQLKDEALPSASSSAQAQQRHVRSMCHIIACVTCVAGMLGRGSERRQAGKGCRPVRASLEARVALLLCRAGPRGMAM